MERAGPGGHEEVHAVHGLLNYALPWAKDGVVVLECESQVRGTSSRATGVCTCAVAMLWGVNRRGRGVTMCVCKCVWGVKMVSVGVGVSRAERAGTECRR